MLKVVQEVTNKYLRATKRKCGVQKPEQYCADLEARHAAPRTATYYVSNGKDGLVTSLASSLRLFV